MVSGQSAGIRLWKINQVTALDFEMRKLGVGVEHRTRALSSDVRLTVYQYIPANISIPHLAQQLLLCADRNQEGAA